MTIIAAIDQNNLIGKDNQLIWHLPNDLKHFKQLTSGHPILMGKNTFLSLNEKPLPNRVNIVVSTTYQNKEEKNILLFDSLEVALQEAKKLDEDFFVIGGAQLYQQCLPLAKRLELTEVHHAFEGDTYFPTFDIEEWVLTKECFHPKDEKHPYDFTFKTYDRK